MSAITAKASRKMKKYAVLTREPRCFLGSFDFSWEQRKLTEFVEFFSGLTYTPNDVQENGTLVLRSSNVSNGEVVDADNIYVNPQVVNSENVKVGDIVVVVRNGSRSLIGKHAQIKAFMPNTVIGAFMTGIRSECPEFTNALLNTSRFEEEIAMNMGATINQITRYMFSKMEFKVPCLDEQKKIGEYFEKLDNLITLHQRKCVFLFGFFQAFISMIFTASTFSWEQRKLGEMGQTYTGLSGKTKDDFGHGQARFVTYMNVFSNPISNPEMTEPIEIDPKQNEVEVGDVFFTTSSETPEEVGMSSILLEKRGKTYLNSFCFGFRPSEKIDSYYLAYMLRSESTRAKIILLAQGISRYNISKNKVMEIAVSLPSLDEQKMIGQYFSQLDNLITLHQRECISFTARAGRLILTANKKRNTSSWEQRKVGDLLIERNQQAPMSDEYPLMAFIASEGVAPKGERYDRSALVTDTVNKLYKKTEKGDFIYSSNNLETGSIGLNKYGKACISPVYSIFEPTGIADSDFLGRRLVRKEFLNAMVKWRQGVIYGQWRIHESDFLKIEITVPSVEEQRKIGAYLDQLDNLITLHQRKPFLMKWRTSDANRNQTNRLVL